MDDLQLLRDFRSDAPRGVPSRAREAFLAEVHPARPDRKGWLVSSAVVLALVAGAVAFESGPGAEPSAASVALNRAAKVVEASETPRPSPEQWFYRASLGGWMNEYDPSSPNKAEGWWTFDGTKYAEAPSDAPHDVHVGTVESAIAAENGSPAELYDAMAALPADPRALLQTLHEAGLVPERGATAAERDYNALTWVFQNEPLPAHVRANLFRALATVPGVEVDEAAKPDLTGRPVIAVTLDLTDDFLGVESRTEALFDPRTYDYTGSRTIATESGRVLAGTEGFDAFDVEAGETVLETASTPAVPVRGPGRRP